jgi:hypothetical protein
MIMLLFSHKHFLPVFAFACILFLNACRSEKDKASEKEKPLAIAGTEELMPEDLKDMVISTGNPKDSAGSEIKSIEKWATDALFYQEALAKLAGDEMQIDRQVQEYKKSLVNYIYQTKIIEANLDTNVSREEIENYYNDNKNSFILKDNIIKVNYYKIPLKVPVLDKMKRFIYSAMPKDKEQLQSLCLQYAENFFVNDSTWLYLDDIKKEIPKLKDQSDLYIYQGRIMELSDDQFYYYLKIKDVKVKNSISPINFERQNIRSFIINRRKTQLIEQYKQQLLEKAKAEKKFQVNPPVR